MALTSRFLQAGPGLYVKAHIPDSFSNHLKGKGKDLYMSFHF